MTAAKLYSSLAQAKEEPSAESNGDSYRMFLGLMTKHQRVQIAPVAVRARFWVRERLSAGREKSLTPARTMDHWVKSMAVVS